jgi:hypothetical protein
MAHPNPKPRYIDPAGDPRLGALPVRPPFLMNGVKSRVFPLKANMARLTQFCDQYLNMDIPPGIVHFRPAVPYVYLMVLDYGSMSSASVQAQNVGWVAQHEVAFTVPLERWQESNGRLVFNDWACVSPFIFVDDELSLTTGREVYGWPKVAGRVDAETPLWAAHPQSAARLFSFSTHVFPKVYAGEPESLRVLLQIDEDPAPSYSRVPPDLTSPWYPLTVAATALRSSMSLTGAAVDMMLALRVRGYRTNRNAASLRAMGGKAGDYLKQLLPSLALLSPGRRATPAAGTSGLSFENITVKQFRDAQEPDRACYKALVSSTMAIDRLNQSGLLGDVNLLRGDASGGYTLRIHRYASQPIIESLGLDIAATEERDDGGSVAILKPTFPFWTDVDLLYGKGRVLCSRAHGQGDDSADSWMDERTGTTPHNAASLPRKTTPHETDHSDYNNALGAATQPVAGPFEFPDVTLQVYPLLADRARLDAYLEHYLNGPLASTGLRFETFGSYVYLLVNVTGDQLGTMWSSANNIGWWAEREVSFCVPVKWYRGDELISVAMVAPFVYANNGRAVITDREVNGRPSIAATIDSPDDVWLTSSGPAKARQFLRLDTEAFPALHLGQKGQQCTLLEIDERDVLPYNDDVGWRMVAQSWGKTLVDDLKRKTEERLASADAVQDAKALALELLAHEAPINWINLKQYRDAADMERACYQAAVHTTRSITRIYDIREIEHSVHVRLHRLSGHPIVEALGLEVKSVNSHEGQVVANLQPVRPFWMRVALKDDLGTVIAWRAADERWQLTHPWFAAPDAPRASPYFRSLGETRVGAWLGRPQGLWQGLRDQSTAWLRQALADELQGIRHAPEGLAPANTDPWYSGLAPADRADFQRLDAAPSVAAFCDATSLERQMALVQIARQARGALGRVPDDPSMAEASATLRRLTHEDARTAIATLDEVQLVVESILSDEWENWGNPRRYQNLPPKPEQCVPSNSLYGGSWILNRNAAQFIADHGLSVTDDGRCWFVAPPPGSPSQPSER